MSTNGFPLLNADGSIRGYRGSDTDITERIQAQERLTKLMGEQQVILDNAPVGITLMIDRKLVWVNDRLAEIMGYSIGELVGETSEKFYSSREEYEQLGNDAYPAIAQGQPFETTRKLIRGDGTSIWVRYNGKAVDSSDMSKGTVWIIEDMTEQVTTKSALEESKAHYQAMIDAFDGLMYICSQDFHIEFMNEKLIKRTGRDATGELCYKALHELENVCPWCVNEPIYAGNSIRWELQSPKDNRWYEVSNTPICRDDGNISKLAMITDITSRKLAADVIKQSEEKFAKAFENAPLIMTISKIEDGTFLEVNNRFCELSGFSRDETIGQTALEVGWITPEDRQRVLNELAQKGQITGLDLSFWKKNKERILVSYFGEVVPINGKHYLLSISLDITAHRLMEEQLLQAQKLESVGRLAGGVAHDFNNMLTVIMGHAQLGMMKLDNEHPAFADFTEISKSAERSADLTRQLLAFARKQTANPIVINLNEAVTATLNMLQRLIGEDISLTWKPSAHLWPVKVDPSQIDQILANLCVNARDAISGTGRITIETANCSTNVHYYVNSEGVEPAEYAILTVSDDGIGMEKATLSHIFEPFFTTKEMGKGTGLGLATVFGIVKQNNGYIDVVSEPGEGTTFTVYLPRYAGKAEKALKGGSAESSAIGNETVLLVEDEPAILNMAKLIITKLGYHVLAANSPGEAMHIARSHVGEIHLLMTDVVMPEMNGKDLARNMLSLYPDIKRLFMSGYTADVIAQHGVLEDGVHFIQKPFNMNVLADKLREVLDR